MIRSVTAAMPAIRVKLSRAWSQNSVSPPKPRSLIIERANSKPYFSASRVTSRFSAKLGLYCGEFLEISQPLLAMGMKTPRSMCFPFKIPADLMHAVCHATGSA